VLGCYSLKPDSKPILFTDLFIRGFDQVLSKNKKIKSKEISKTKFKFLCEFCSSVVAEWLSVSQAVPLRCV
jgi:hypothetical protein